MLLEGIYDLGEGNQLGSLLLTVWPNLFTVYSYGWGVAAKQIIINIKEP